MKKNKMGFLVIFLVIVVVISIISCIYFKIDYDKKIQIEKEQALKLEQEQEEEQNQIYENIKNNYNEFVVTISDTNLYDSDNNICGTISKGIELELEEKEIKNYEDIYFKLKNIDYYIKYDSVSKIDNITENSVYNYNNYIPFNENIVITGTNMYVSDEVFYNINSELSLPILIKDDDKYYVKYDNKLVYIMKDSNYEIIQSSNSDDELANSVAVLNYHFTVNFEAGELELCTPQSICIEDSLLDEHIKYIKDNDFFAMKMEDLELFLDGKINISKKSVVITFDDGPFMQRAISILEKYDIDATLFLIGVYYNPADYESKNLFLASHTWNLHGVGICSDKEYGGGITCLSEEEIQEDLRKSRESLNNTTYLCLPFYEYNSYSLEQITKAGFTMAFVGGMRKAYPGINKLTVPRYVIYNTTSVDELANIIN